jgi:DNA invertase Pin-like site-specific DNA recombinase
MAKRHSTLIPAAGYARRSTDMQERSIPDQQAYIEKWAAEHGYRIIRWYIDDAISGTSAKGRNAFEQMIAVAENGRDFEAILCYDISRFSRGGTNETGYYLHRLRLAGVEVLFTADGIPEGDEGELIQGVKSWQARQYSVKLARDTIRGQLSSIRKSHSAPGGPPPYGYDKQHVTPDGKVLRTLRWMSDGSKQEFGPDGKLLRVIASKVFVAKAKGDIVRYVPSTPDRVAAIRRIFELCVAGYGIRYTAEALNNDGVPTMLGAKWNSSNIAMLLKNPVYRGSLVYNKRTSGSLFGLDAQGKLRPKKGKRLGSNPHADWIIEDEVHEPLVSRETFDAAQQAIAKRRDAGGKARPVQRTLCSTLLVCKRCGNSFTTVRDARRKPEFGPPYRHYTCSGYHRYGKAVCGLVRIPGPALDEFVLGTIKRVLLGDHATTGQAIDAFVKSILGPSKAAKQAPDAQRELEQLDRRIKTTVGMLADLTFEGLDDLHKVLADLKSKRDALLARLRSAPRQAKPALSERQLRTWAREQFDRLDELAQRTTVDLQDRQLVEAYVQRIEVFPETSTGIVYLHADLQVALQSCSTGVVGGDDPQTDESARSLSQCAHRESVLAGAVLGLAGPGRKISGIMPCTVRGRKRCQDSFSGQIGLIDGTRRGSGADFRRSPGR